MSDFDKEAERQKLREKYDRDREKRKETERMSQLLLQGATMTNRHCGTCGDPLFRYEGNEFCATCEGRAEEAATEDGSTTDTGSNTDEPAATAATDGAADSAAPDDVDADAAGHPSPSEIGGNEGPGADASDDTRPGTAPATRSTASQPTAGSNTPSSVDAPATSAHGGSGDDGDLDAARAALVRTLTAHARQAEAADGPRRATDHLAAAREAAEALAALDGIRQ